MKVSTFGKATIGLAAAATMGFGLVVPTANAAGAALTATQEDPAVSAIGPNTLVGVGSDTIQDVEYGISQDLGTQPDGTLNLASWTATGTTAMSYRSGGAPATPSAHPNGSGAGYTALKESLGISPTGADGVARGDINYSRASGFQGTEATNSGNANVAGTGVVTEIPFAVDSISFAAPAGSPFAKTNAGLGLTLADLAKIYIPGTSGYNEVNTSNGVLGYTANATPDAGNVFIQAYLPKPGSGSRQFFLKDLAAINSGIQLGTNKGDSYQTSNGTPSATGAYIGNTDLAGASVQEHDASAILEPNSANVATIAPFSGAKFIGYHNGTIADPSTKVAGTDYELIPFDSAVGGTSHAVLPYTDNGGVFAPNATYKADGSETAGANTAKLTREVFNIVATRAIKNPNASVINRELYDTFVGGGSKFCLDSATIQAYGFIKDSNCGNISRSADVASTSTVTVSNAAAVAGKTSVFTVNVGSNSNGGGQVAITINGTLYNGTIAPGATSVNFTVPTPAAGTFQYGTGANDGFTPNLDGVGAAPVNPNPGTPLTYTVAKASATVTASAPRVSHLRVGTVTVKVAAAGLHPTGTVTVWVKTTTGVTRITLSGKAINATTGAVTLSLGKALPVGNYYVWVSYSGNANINAKAAARLAVLSVV